MGRTSGGLAGNPGADVQNRADFAFQVPDVRLGTRMSGLWPGCPARRFQISFGAEIFEFGAELMIPRAKLMRFRGWKVGKLGEMLDPLETKQIHGSKSTKHHQTNKSQKKLGLFLVGIFGFRMKSTKSS